MPRYKIYLLTGDILLIIVAFYLAPMLRFGVFLDPDSVFDLSDVVAILMYPLVFYIFDFYNFQERSSKTEFILRCALAIFIINFISTSLFFVFHIRPYSADLLGISGSFAFVFLVALRLSFRHFLNRAAPLKVLILGAGETGKALYDYLRTRNDYKVIGFIDDSVDKNGLVVGDVQVMGNSSHLSGLIKKYDIDQVVVAITGLVKPEMFRVLVDVKFTGVEVYEMPTFYEKVAEKIPVLHTTSMWLGFAEISGVKRNVYNTKLKKIFDKLISVVALILAMPIMLLTALFIKLESRGPILYKQERIGKDEKTFELIKFRSMRVDAEANGAVWAMENDPRVTRVGKVIRRLRLDELPQLWNVLKGDMSFVGPRPERMEFVRYLKKEIPYYALRHAIGPGITGWAQINYPYGASTKDALQKLQFDLYYIKNMSVILDMYIIIQTIRVMLLKKGAR